MADAPEAALQLFWRSIDLEKTGVNNYDYLLCLLSCQYCQTLVVVPVGPVVVLNK